MASHGEDKGELAIDPCPGDVDWQRDYWSFALAVAPQQQNGHDCGVYAVVLAIFMTRFPTPQSLDASRRRIIWLRAFRTPVLPL